MRLRLFLVLGFLWGVGCDLFKPQDEVKRTIRVLDPELQPILSPLQVTEGEWVDVSAGDDQTCAIRKDGSLWCWGRGVGIQKGFLTRVGGVAEWALVELALYADHTCAIRRDRTLWCWGSFGLFRSASYSDDPSVPTLVDPTPDWVQVAMGASHACGIREDRTLWCWGPFFSLPPTEVAGKDRWIKVSVPRLIDILAIREDHTLWYWRGSIGGDITGPTQVGENQDWVTVDGGTDARNNEYLCALKGNGTLWCGGSESLALVTADTGWVQVSVGWDGFACALKEDHSLWCWGRNQAGQLGVGDRVYRGFPTQVGTDRDWVKVSAGRYHTCALKGNGTLWCWGAPYGVRIKGVQSP